jgi:hypothetical protein
MPAGRHWFSLTLLLPLCATGCGPLFGTPQIWPPAPEATQIARARRFDPFPDPNIGPPVIGGRPQGFIDPRPDPDPNKTVRSDWFNPTPGAGYPPAGYPPPGYYPGAPVAYPPPATTIYTYPSSITAAPPPGALPPPMVAYPSTVPPVTTAPAITSLVPATATAAPIAYGKKIDSP